VNRQTAAWFGGDAGGLRRELALSLRLAIAVVALALVALAICAATLLQWLGAPGLADDPWLLGGVAVWGCGNAVQHVYGSFTVSYGSGFGFALKASLWASLGAGLVFLGAHAGGFAVGPSLVAMGVAYGLSTMAYPIHVQRLMSQASGSRW